MSTTASRKRILLLAWLAALVLSNGYRFAVPAERAPSPGQRTVMLAEIDGEDTLPSRVRMAYSDSGQRDAPVVMLIHGTPVAGSALQSLTAGLDTRFRIVVPDLPGFGASTLRVADSSFPAHARYLAAFMDELKIEQAHLVAYSQGGGPALHLYALDPQRVQSLTLASSIGVQELELFGDYHLNHALYAAQLWTLRAAGWLIPHFGHLDDAWLNIPYACNLHESDQRPLRGILQRLEVPTLILHGRDDRFVPFAAAIEHHRLVPHSELVAFTGGHGLVFKRDTPFAPELTAFIDKTERGAATARSDADAARTSAAAAPFDWSAVPPYMGLTLFLVLAGLALSTYVSEDLACIAAGLLVARGLLEFWPATLACLAGIFSGDLLLFLAGRYFGRHVTQRAPLKWFVNDNQMRYAREWFERRGALAILTSRFVPGTRLPTYVAAGTLGVPLPKFTLWFLVAAAVWTPLLVASAYAAGVSVLSYFDVYQRYGLPLLAGLLALLFVAVRVLLPLASFRGRRLLYSRWQRIRHWEFWPPWIFYPPLVAYIVFLGLRYRSLTLFTAANPAMPASGFVGESKSAILDGLAGAGKVLARYELIPAASVEDRRAAVRRFIERESLDWPIVLKPDVGERGKDVCIAHSSQDIDGYLRKHPAPTIVQEFAAGHEFGVFYYRLPGEPHGQIFAVTDKRPPAVTGDGIQTLEQLILRDERAVCMASLFLGHHADRLEEVPAAGEQVTLVEIGTHCRGCKFVDGAWVVTERLDQAIDRISQTYDGFFFGRYDIRTPCVEDFRAGHNFKIVELNGVSSEATNIYDPRNSLWKAYRVLMAQWRLAFRIGARNRDRGARPVTVRELLASILHRDRTQPRPGSDEVGDARAEAP